MKDWGYQVLRPWHWARGACIWGRQGGKLLCCLVTSGPFRPTLVLQGSFCWSSILALWHPGGMKLATQVALVPWGRVCISDKGKVSWWKYLTLSHSATETSRVVCAYLSFPNRKEEENLKKKKYCWPLGYVFYWKDINKLYLYTSSWHLEVLPSSSLEGRFEYIPAQAWFRLPRFS